MQEGFKSLIVWQKSMTLAKEVFRRSEAVSIKERYGLVDQMRRSATSIPSNIAEGSRRGSKRDYANFISIAHGSTAELETQLLLGHDCYPKAGLDKLLPLVDEVSRMLLVLGKRLRS